MSWVYVPSWDVAICSPPKCASRSLLITIASAFHPGATYEKVKPSTWRQRSRHYQYMSAAKVQHDWPKLAIVRDPIDRFVSLWAHHCRDGVPGIPFELREGATMRELIDFIGKNKNKNEHWSSQSYIIGKQLNIQYCDVHAIDQVWPEFTKGLAPAFMRENVTQNREGIIVPPDIVEELKRIYEPDFRWAT